MTVLAWLVVATALGYGALVTLMFVFQRRLMYFPDPARVTPAAAGLPQAREVSLTSSDGEKLIAWFVPPCGEGPLVIYFQGNAEGLPARVGRFLWMIAAGYGVLALCYRGYGGSTGHPSEHGLIRDAEAAYEFAHAHVPAKRIVLFGESLGTGVAVVLAATHEIAGIVLDAPFTSIADVGAAAYPFVPVRWALKDRFRSDTRIAEVAAPLLVLHGKQDQVVPVRFGERLFALAREPKRMVRFPRGGHVDLDDYGAPEAVRAFLAALPPAS